MIGKLYRWNYLSFYIKEITSKKKGETGQIFSLSINGVKWGLHGVRNHPRIYTTLPATIASAVFKDIKARGPRLLEIKELITPFTCAGKT